MYLGKVSIATALNCAQRDEDVQASGGTDRRLSNLRDGCR